MRRFYISSTRGTSGISKYSQDFYQLVLKDKGYIFIDSSEEMIDILSTISSRDHVHIEIGIFQKKEIDILFTMLKANYRNVAVTLHDAPLIKYPFFEFNNALLNNLSKLSDQFANSFGAAKPYVKKIKSIFVLSRRGVNAVRKRYGATNVYYLPHIVNTKEIEKSEQKTNDFIYLGFIGRNKGIEYSLQLHQEILSEYPDINFYIAGTALGRQKKYYDFLKEKYKKNVHFLGYVPEQQLNDLFRQTTFALLPFKDYRFFWPFSGSVLYTLKKGKVLFTNKVNAIPEIIEDGKNGFYLTGDLKTDKAAISRIIDNTPRLEAVKSEAYNYLLRFHSADAVKQVFQD